VRIRDQGGGVSPANLPFIFSYAFTTTGKNPADIDDELEDGPYTAQYVGGSAAINGDVGSSEGGLFGEITSKGLQNGMGTLSGLGYGYVFLPECTSLLRSKNFFAAFHLPNYMLLILVATFSWSPCITMGQMYS
jgi:hypothetical protein